MSIKHDAAYEKGILDSIRRGDHGTAQYAYANYTVERLREGTLQGEEPTESAFQSAALQLEHAAADSKGHDEFAHYRARLIGAFLRPIVWADILNIEGLSCSEAKRVSVRLGLAQAAATAMEICHDALDEFDELTAMVGDALSEDRKRRRIEVAGFLNEATPVLLGTRFHSAKLLTLPTLAYDDRFNPDKSLHVDGTTYDNRRRRGQQMRHPYQVGGRGKSNAAYDTSIVVLTPLELGNTQKTSHWHHSDKSFTTVRTVIAEHGGEALNNDVHSRLDRLTNFVHNKIMKLK